MKAGPHSGQPLALSALPDELILRYLARVKRGVQTECWPWIGCRNREGYGVIGFNAGSGNKIHRSHRLAFVIDGRMDIPPGWLVCHHCDNRPCCNPAHLYLGTQAENMEDAHRRGRKTVAKPRLTAEQIQDIRSRCGSERQAILAAEYGVTQGAISHIHRHATWKHLKETA